MSLLDEIIHGASEDSQSVATLLRRVKVLASRLDAVSLDEWVGHELAGYPDTESLPAYRGPFPAEVLGTFAGPFNSSIRAAPVPSVGFPADMREGWMFKVAFTEPISELEQLSHAKKQLQVP